MLLDEGEEDMKNGAGNRDIVCLLCNLDDVFRILGDIADGLGVLITLYDIKVNNNGGSTS